MKSKQLKRKEALARAQKGTWATSRAYRRWVVSGQCAADDGCDNVAALEWAIEHQARLDHLITLI